MRNQDRCTYNKNKEVHDTVMKFCQARLSPPLIGQIAANASLAVIVDICNVVSMSIKADAISL